MFARDGDRALCLIDLDTLARMPIALELGDALRSWCNPRTEDATDAHFQRPLFEAAVEGYAAEARGFLTPVEWQSIPAGTLTVCVELAARFCTDALRERYFRWDASRYPSASAHNQARTRGQLQVAENAFDRARRDARCHRPRLPLTISQLTFAAADDCAVHHGRGRFLGTRVSV